MTLRGTTFETSRTDLLPLPIDRSWIRKGAPIARSVTLSKSPDTLLTAGLWDCTAGTFTWIFRRDEVVHILEGEVRVHDGHTTHVLVPGCVAYFPRGLETVWEVPTYVKKAFVLRAPPPSLMSRMVSALKAGIGAFSTRSLVALAMVACALAAVGPGNRHSSPSSAAAVIGAGVRHGDEPKWPPRHDARAQRPRSRQLDNSSEDLHALPERLMYAGGR